ncbi:unnamed protein product, partial [Tetraodon nigroviridis]
LSLVPREELENNFMRLQEENLHLKKHANKKDDEMKKLGTKLKKMANDQDRLARLVMGRGQVGLADQRLDVMVGDLQQRLQVLERQNEELKQGQYVARKQRCLRNGGNSVYSGQQKLQNNVPSCFLNPPKKARAEISSLKNNNMLQQNRIKEMEGALERLQDQLRTKEVEHQKKLLKIQQQEASKIWSNVENNVTLTKLQKQITEKSNTMVELQERFLQMQRSHRALKANYHTAVGQMNDLMACLNKEKEKSFRLEKRLQGPAVDDDRVQGLHLQLAQVKEERDVLRERISKLHKHTYDVCQAQKSQLQEQQSQISQLQAALKAERVDKNLILGKFEFLQETNQELAAEMRKLKNDSREKQRQLAELQHDARERRQNEKLLLVKKQTNRREKESQTGGVAEVEDSAKAMQELQDAHSRTMQELQDAHSRTMQELQKSEKLLSAEREICQDFKLKLEAMTRKIQQDQARAEQKHQTQLLGAGAGKISRLEAQFRRSDTATHAGRAEFTGEGGSREERVHLECGESLIELQIVGARLSPSALELLGESEPATFCTYTFFRFDTHGTLVVRGQHPKYSFTSRYVVGMEEAFLDYVSSCAVLVELHQRLVGREWRTMATAHLPLRPLLEREGTAEGSVPLVAVTNEALAFGALDYCVRLKLPGEEL